MRRFQMPAVVVLSFFILSACSVFGEVTVRVAPYEVLESEDNFELRHYEHLVLVKIKMSEGMSDASSPFRKLFKYISGENRNSEKIAMTAPVFMDQDKQTTDAMSFVLPVNYSLATAPRPNDPSVKLTELKDYTVAVVTFSGLLNQDNISTHQSLLEDWVADKQLKVTGPIKAAGYNPPFTLPFLRRNEILIPVTKP